MTLEVKNLVKIFNRRKVLNNISFKVENGQTLGVVGFSGSGKSTLLKIISGILDSDGGEVIYPENSDIAMAFQYSALFDFLNVYDNIAFPLVERKDLRGKYSKEQITQIVKEKLKMVGLDGIEEKYPSELSGGMQKRVGFARAIVTNPQIILYDEPTAGLDPVTSTLIEDYIVQLKKDLNASCVVVTHQLSTIKRAVDNVIMLYQGNAVFEGSVDELLMGKNEYARQFVSAAIDGPMNIASK
ncbi:MAG: ATP-binding cassette domain-containing protein [Candidatus Gastranaerophilales bacterium]|nr:ATP-binding cassette domain-containing protein [Candidatus Gastranaerophilales bacterium]